MIYTYPSLRRPPYPRSRQDEDSIRDIYMGSQTFTSISQGMTVEQSRAEQSFFKSGDIIEFFDLGIG